MKKIVGLIVFGIPFLGWSLPWLWWKKTSGAPRSREGHYVARRLANPLIRFCEFDGRRLEGSETFEVDIKITREAS